MRAHLCDSAFLQDYDLVGVADGGKAMRHHDNRFPLVEIRKIFGDGPFVVRIKGIGSFVQENEHRVLVDDPCDEDALSLPLTDALSVLSYHRVVG